MTTSMTRRLHEGLSTFIQKVMLEESMKTEEHTMRLVLKFEGWELPPDRVDSAALAHPAECHPLEWSGPRCSTRPGNFSATRPGVIHWNCQGQASPPDRVTFLPPVRVARPKREEVRRFHPAK